MHIFVISLDRSVDRRAKVLSRLTALGLTAEVFPAIDGYSLPLPDPHYDGRTRRLLHGKDMTPGEIGCARSHLAVYKELLRRGMPYALILEDDAILEDTLPKALRCLEEASDTWDLVRFLGKAKDLKRMRRQSLLSDGLALTRIYGTPGGAYGYVLNRRAASHLADCGFSRWMPIDTLHGQVWYHRLRVRGLSPSPVLPELDNLSTIGDDRFCKSYRLSGWERCVFPFSRFGFKVFDTIAKNVTYSLGLLRDCIGSRA